MLYFRFLREINIYQSYQLTGMAFIIPAYPTPPYQPGTLLYNVEESWRPVLEPEFNKPYFAQLTRFVCDERKMFTVYPSAENVFSWTQYCTVDQGWTPQPPCLSFSVLHNELIPDSLMNIFKELREEFPATPIFQNPPHGYLKGWADQGVLMLNSVLTVREGAPESHKRQGWEQFTDAVIAYLSNSKDGLVFVLWGGMLRRRRRSLIRKDDQ
ncbi:UNG-like protein [Mya arenaria]|uniref:UNG-like protein n=1 Tax=Mya arenaria TaxID=6604 RepID=A0ABY7FHP5_MYAAR|nr:UNG-like protein [Mya arenaria]